MEAFSPAITLPTPFNAPALLRNNWTTTPTESLAAAQDGFDNGHMRLLRQRYIKRSVKVSLLLRGRAEIAAFRRFAFQCQGRANSFLWTAPMDAAEGRWRLASDAVEIEYVTRVVARVNLELAETSQ